MRTRSSVLLFAALCLAVVVAGACTGSAGDTGAPADASVPRFEPATADIAAMVGRTIGAADLPAMLEATGATDELRGSVIVDSGAGSADGYPVAMHWVERGDHVNVVTADQVGYDDVGPSWRIHSAWVLVLDPSMVFTVGTTVCKPERQTVDWERSGFVAVVNRAQDQALGAWAIDREGPLPYPDFGRLRCERFVP